MTGQVAQIALAFAARRRRVEPRSPSGWKIADLGLPPDDRRLTHFCVKEAVMPWGRFPGADIVLGPEMKSTGEVMGIADTYAMAICVFANA